jgi:carboxyl-terminal processing protease
MVGCDGQGKGRMMRKVSTLALGVAIGAGAVTLVSQTRWMPNFAAEAAPGDTYRKLNLFGDIFEQVRANYVEQPDEGKMIDAAINGMLTSLDPHSNYLDPKATQELQNSTSGRFGGLGIEVTYENNQVKVVTPIDDTPASRAGVLANDIITHIDGAAVDGMSLNQAIDKMRGDPGTKVVIKVQRGADKKTVEISLVRDFIKPKVVRARKEGDDLVYLRIGSFNERTFEELKKGIEDTTKEIGADKVKGYILDLRNNPGGLLDQAIAVSDGFLERGEIVSTRARQPEDTQRFSARAGDLINGKKLVVLVNGGSASASEIVAGALQDLKRSTTIGTRSFGKGSVQTIFPLGANGALKLTTQLYFTPSGRSIQGKGITPEMIVKQEIPADLKGKDETEGEASLKGHIVVNNDEGSGSSAYVPPDPKDDKQLIQAVDFLHGKVSVVAPTAPAKPDEKTAN